jgi:hypothetical protein
MKRRIVTSFDQRFYLDPDDFFKTFALCKGMKKVVEIIGCLELAAISPTGYSRQFAEEGLLPDARMTRTYFLDGQENNAHLRKALESATMIVCKVEPLRYSQSASAYLHCEFRRDKIAIAQIEFIFSEDGNELVCCGRSGYETAVSYA